MNKVHQRASGAWRVASAFVSLGLLAWGLAAVAYVNTTGAYAETNPQFHAVDVAMVVPQGGELYTVAVEMLILDSGNGTFEQDVATARAEMVERFPGAVAIDAQNEDGYMESNFVLSGFKWTANSATWNYDGTGAPSGISGSAMSAMQAAGSTWGQQGATFQFMGGGPSSSGTGACGGGGTNGSNTVGWGNQSGAVLAVTCSWFANGPTPRAAIEFDMQFDPDWNWSTGGSGVDLQSVALHEFGHAAGLNHSASGSAVMFASYTSGTIKQTPTQDDVNGLIAIYGAVGGGSPTNTPTNTPPAATNTPTRTPTPTNTPGGGGGQNTPTPGLPTSTPTKTPTSPPGGGGGSPTPPQATSTPTKTPTPGSGGANPTATATNTPSATPTRATTATATPTPANSLPILPGANLMAWPGGDLPPAQALAGVQNLRVVYAYDAATGNWTRYVPGAPSFLNNLLVLKKGGSYWFIATGSAQVPFQP